MKYTTKYLTYGLLAILVICGVGWFIQSQRTAKEAHSVAPSDTDAPIPIPHLSPKRSASDGHFHADGSFHADSLPQGIGNSTRSVSKNSSAPSHRSSRQKTANKSSLGWITWKFGYTGIRSTSPYYPDWTLLPEEITYNFRLLVREQNAREWLQGEMLNGKDIDDLLNSRHPDLGLNGVEWIGRCNHVPDPMSVLLDKKRNPLPPFTESEYATEELRRLVGDRDPEEAAQFLAQHGHYNALLLSRLDDESAFDYLYAISSPIETSTFTDQTRMYAERLASSDPDHLKARLYLADISPRSSASDYEAALAQYDSILVDHPNSVHALIEAGAVLNNLDRPFQSVAYFERGHELGSRHGHFSAGIAYQKLGDYKTAWVYLKKAFQVSEGDIQFAVAKHLDAIKAGVPRIEALPVEKLDIPEKASIPPPFASDTDSVLDVPLPPTESEVPSVRDSDLPDESDEYHRARAQARAEAEAARREEIELMRKMSQQEIDEFIQWAEQLMHEEASAVQTTDFLAKELAAHLTGKPAQFSPQRIVRANELIKRYGYEEGLNRIIQDDPEIALQIQLLRNQETIPEKE